MTCVREGEGGEHGGEVQQGVAHSAPIKLRSERAALLSSPPKALCSFSTDNLNYSMYLQTMVLL